MKTKLDRKSTLTLGDVQNMFRHRHLLISSVCECARVAIAPLLIFCMLPLGVPGLYAQEAPPPARPAYAQLDYAQLDQLVAPIALYPDALVAQILAAATYSPQIVEADRFAQKNAGMPPQDLARTVDTALGPQREGFNSVSLEIRNRGMNMSWKCLPMRIQTFTGFLPLWCGIAPQHNAEQLLRKNYLADDRLNARWGARSLSQRETMYLMEFSSNPSNWLGPMWIIVNYFVWKGLQRYGYKKEADAQADKTILLLSRDLERNGSLNETTILIPGQH